VSYEASSIAQPNRWRKLYAAALSAAPHILTFTDLMAAIAFVSMGVAV
jgi:hypothetical protein